MVYSDSDSDISLQSGDPDKYWWLRGDYPYGYPDNWAHDDEGQHADPVSPPPPSEARGSSNYDHVVPDLNDPTQAMHDRITQLETFLEDRDRQLGESDATIQELLERVASLCTYIVTLWVRLQESDKKKRAVTVALCLAVGIIFVLLAFIFARLT